VVRRALLIALALAGCKSSSDPCSGVSGTCLTVEVSAPQPLRVDTLTFDATGALTGMRQTSGAATELPLKVALKLPAGTSGSIDLVVEGLLAGSVVGHGENATSIASGGHASLPVELTPIGMPGGGDDLAGTEPGDDLASPDLSMLQPIILPTAPVMQSDLDGTGLSSVTLPAGVTILNADTGAISGGIRNANSVFTDREVNNGIAFHSSGGVGIFSFGALTVPVGAQLRIYGNEPVALVSASTIVVNDLVEARPMDINGNVCAVGSNGVGGGKGGASGTPNPPAAGGSAGQNGSGVGPGGGGGRNAAGTAQGAGGGGGHAGSGGTGLPFAAPGASPNAPGGAGGGVYDAAALTGFHGGSGGGGYGSSGGTGGGGGGAVQLVAKTAISFGIDTARGGINSGGCGGKAPGAGGGSGGAILVEAPTVQLGAMGTLAANGAGGAGNDSANNAHDGSDATFDANIAYGGGSNQFNPNGGNGAAGATLAGTSSGAQTTGPYAGGGGAGWIRINTASGTPSMTAGAILSPFTSTNATTFGTITLQ
jgi:hypothetical protein